MKALLLAAGYSTRLYPLTKNFPKPLLEIGNKPVITHILEKLEPIPEIDEVYVITNNKFYQHFLDWKESLNTRLKIDVINDGTLSESDKLGAIGDIIFALIQKSIDDDLFILGGDNLFNFELKPMVDYFKKHNKDLISLKKETDVERIKQMNSVKLSDNNQIIFFEEKPTEPKSDLAANCIYIYTKETVQLFKKYVDQPGRFVQWLYSQKEIHGFINEGDVIDIGTHATLEKARKDFTSAS